MSENRVVVTGANGFVGQHLCRQLVESGKQVTACLRDWADASRIEDLNGPLRLCRVSSLDSEIDIARAMRDADAVIHLAGRVHIMEDRVADPLREYRKVNVAITQTLARAAIQNGVRRFIYVSSAKVNGEATQQHTFSADDVPGYCDPYGQSKWEAEECLRQIAGDTKMGWVILRPPLVYGPQVKGNFLTLMKCVGRRLPLPFGSVHNKRSLVSVYNLSDLLCHLVDHPAAANNRFLVSDPEDVSTPDLIRRIAEALRRPSRIMCCPESVLTVTGSLFRQKAAVQRLCASLVLDKQKTRNLLGWTPPLDLDSGLAITAKWFTESIARITL